MCYALASNCCKVLAGTFTFCSLADAAHLFLIPARPVGTQCFPSENHLPACPFPKPSDGVFTAKDGSDALETVQRRNTIQSGFFFLQHVSGVEHLYREVTDSNAVHEFGAAVIVQVLCSSASMCNAQVFGIWYAQDILCVLVAVKETLSNDASVYLLELLI